MAKAKTIFVCSNCGYESAKWLGKCPACNEWNTFYEEKMVNSSSATTAGNARAKSVPKKLKDIDFYINFYIFLKNIK